MAKWKFECPKRGHQPIEKAPEEQVKFGDHIYTGRICRFCGCVYYTLEGEAGLVLVPRTGNA
jgi:hypothetical protein